MAVDNDNEVMIETKTKRQRKQNNREKTTINLQ